MMLKRPLMFCSRLLAIAIILFTGTAFAQETPNGPGALIGTFGKSPAQCQSYHRKSDDLTIITSSDYQFCGGSWCTARIVSHHKTDDGYVLRLVSRNNPQGWKWVIRQIDDNVFERSGEGKDFETLVRCSTKDSIAGIGRSGTYGGGGQPYNVIFIAYYVQTIPTVCPTLKIREWEIQQALVVAKSALMTLRMKQKINRPGVSPDVDAAEHMSWQERHARHAVAEDAKAIPQFCKEVLDVFGTDGRLMPGLIVDPRQKT